MTTTTQTPSIPTAWAPVFNHEAVLATNLDELEFDPETGWLTEESPALFIVLHVGFGYRGDFAPSIYYREVNGGCLDDLDDYAKPEEILRILNTDVEYDSDSADCTIAAWKFHRLGTKTTETRS